MTQRMQVKDSDIMDAIGYLAAALIKRLEKHGRHTWYSSHEILGVLTEEYQEVIDEVRNNDSAKMREELLDVAVAAIHGVVSIDAGLDWPKKT